MERKNKTTVFLVEDNDFFAKTLAIFLRNKGYEVQTFASGEEMISSWEEDPDIILLDYYIETRQGVAMNGDKILHFIRRISKNLPVVILTSNEDISEATTMLKKGAVDYILKDNELQHNLEKTLVQILEARQLRQEISENRLKIKKYRQRFVIICLVLALAAVTILWLST
jgi:CheY-like chemotaxis protein